MRRDDRSVLTMSEHLQSRGIRQQEARHMILYAFAAELTEAIHDSALKQQVLPARIGQLDCPELV
ncbi:hypothetical protein KCP69_14805 [Salmonella enterica subsp. enterica]|nr:hypothetical protein KCP69_14805 [Salmonella enterica subsp. enterica]